MYIREFKAKLGPRDNGYARPSQHSLLTMRYVDVVPSWLEGHALNDCHNSMIK